MEGTTRALWRVGGAASPPLGLPRAPFSSRRLGIGWDDARALPALPRALRAIPLGLRRLTDAFGVSAVKCRGRSTDGWCLLQIPERDVDALFEINKHAKLFSSWVSTGGPEPGSLGGADAAARDMLKRSYFRRRLRRRHHQRRCPR